MGKSLTLSVSVSQPVRGVKGDGVTMPHLQGLFQGLGISVRNLARSQHIGDSSLPLLRAPEIQSISKCQLTKVFHTETKRSALLMSGWLNTVR